MSKTYASSGMSILAHTKLFIAFAFAGILGACASPSQVGTLATPTSTVAKSLVAPTATETALPMPDETPIPTTLPTAVTSPTSTSTPEATHAPAKAPVAFDAQGVLYERLEDGTSRRVQPSTDKGRTGQIAMNGNGAVWFFTERGVSQVASGHITHFADERAAMVAAFPWTGAQALWPVAPDGTIWTVAEKNLMGYDGNVWRSVPLDEAAAETVDWIAAGLDGLLAVTDTSGLSVYTPETGWQVPTLPKGLSRDLWRGNNLLAGPDGSLWIGLDVFGTGGLLRYIPASQKWTVYAGQNGDLPWIGVAGLAVDASGDVWIANDTRGVLAVRRATSGIWEYILQETPFPNVYGFGRIFFGAHGDLWLPTIGHCGENGEPCWLGIAHYANGIWKRYTAMDGLASDHVFAVAVDPTGVAWLVTDVGLQRFQP